MSEFSIFESMTELSDGIYREQEEARKVEIEALFAEIKEKACQINRLPGDYLLATYRDRLNDKELVKILYDKEANVVGIR